MCTVTKQNQIILEIKFHFQLIYKDTTVWMKKNLFKVIFQGITTEIKNNFEKKSIERFISKPAKQERNVLTNCCLLCPIGKQCYLNHRGCYV